MEVPLINSVGALRLSAGLHRAHPGPRDITVRINPHTPGHFPRCDSSSKGCSGLEAVTHTHTVKQTHNSNKASVIPQQAIEQHTRPTSTRLVTMTIHADCSCQIILQKSYTVSWTGPGEDITRVDYFYIRTSVHSQVSTHQNVGL